MAEVKVSDVLVRAGGLPLRRFGVAACGGWGRRRVQAIETFTRADPTNCATAFGPDSLARVAAAGALRNEWVDLDGDGVRETLGIPIEGGRTQIAHFTRDLTNAFWTKEASDTVTADAGQAVDGSQTADKVVEAAVSSLHGFNRSFAFTAASNLSWSVVLEAAGRTVLQLMVRSDAEANGFRGQFDLSGNGTYTQQAAQGTGTLIGGGIVKLRTGKYRCWLSGKVDPAATAALARCNYNNPAGTITYVGDGASGMIASDMQFEIGPFPSSIIPALAGLDVVRAADAMLVPLPVGPNVDLTVLATVWRPYYGDAVPANSFFNLYTLGDTVGAFAEARFNNFGNSGIAAVVGNPAGTEQSVQRFPVPGGALVQTCAQFKSLTTGPQVRLDVGDGQGFTAFSPALSAAFSKYATQFLYVGSRGGSTAFMFSVLIDLLVARGQFTLAEMQRFAAL